MKKRTLYLASTSPRRRQLLALLGIPFELLAADLDETPIPGESAQAMVERLCRAKALAALAQRPEGLILAADTTVALDDTILVKPLDSAEAAQMLSLLRGRAHIVYTGIALAEERQEWVHVTATTVWMREYSDAEIAAYVATGDPLDKAAAYAVQHRIFKPVARVEGCFANVMGLPLCVLAEGLGARGYAPAPGSLACLAHPEWNCAVPARLGLD